LAGSLRRLLAALGLLAFTAAPLCAQVPVELAGRVVRLVGPDSQPLVGVKVSAHRIGKTVQGVVDSMSSGAGGAFRFRLRGDSAAIYLVSARSGGVEYFSEAIRPPGARAMLIVVSDTSSAVPVTLMARHVIVSRPDPAGARAILDLVTLRNASGATRVARDSLSPTWRLVLPAGALEPTVEEGDVSGAAVEFRGDTLLLFAPVAPGRKNMMLSYRLPASEVHPSWTAPSDSFDLLVEEGDATVQGAGLMPAAPVTLMERQLRRWSAHPPSGPAGEIRFAAAATDSAGLLWGLVGVVAAVLAAGAFVLLRRRPRPSPVRAAPPVDLIEELARLDARYLGRQGEVPAAEWKSYQAERARLKAAAEAAALARRRPRP
jgi:hypothetical protein